MTRNQQRVLAESVIELAIAVRNLDIIVKRVNEEYLTEEDNRVLEQNRAIMYKTHLRLETVFK